MTAHIANCGYSNFFTAGLFKIGHGQSTPSYVQGSLLDRFRQSSASPLVLLIPSKPSSPRLHLPVPSNAESKRRLIVTPTSPIIAIKSPLLSAGSGWRWNERRRDVKGLNSTGNALQTLCPSSEQSGSCHFPQSVSRIKRYCTTQLVLALLITEPHLSIPTHCRCIGASPKPPPTAPLPPPPPSSRRDDIKPLIPHDFGLAIAPDQHQARLVTSNGKPTLTSVVNEDQPPSPFQGEGEGLPDSPIQIKGEVY